MDDYTFVAVDGEVLEELQSLTGTAGVILDKEKVNKLSKDFYWYSPWLREMLEDKQAAAVAKVDSLEILIQVIQLAVRKGWPLTIRGGGTGNYGQCIPLCGGLVLDLSGMDTIHSIENGIIRAEPGARLGTIEPAVREKGYEFRCLPSTWVKSSLGGFLCGGSGGIGSITWGGLAVGDNIKSVTLLSVEEEPRLQKFEEEDAIDALHTYGTTGIMVEIEMRLAPKRLYQQLIINSPDWEALLDWTHAIAQRADIPKRLVTQFEAPVPTYFRPLKKFLNEGEHATFLLIDQDHYETVIEEATEAGFDCVYSVPMKEPIKPPYITDYTWNHGTLWAIKANPEITYLQAGYDAGKFKEQMQQLRDQFPGEIYQHLEWTCQDVRKEGETYLPISPDTIAVGGLPKVIYKGRERLQEILDYCEEIGVGIANPHTCFLEEGGRHPNLQQKLEMKASFDPHGLLNPGKLKTYGHNPFLALGAM